jgi:hypothetical protein
MGRRILLRGALLLKLLLLTGCIFTAQAQMER